MQDVANRDPLTQMQGLWLFIKSESNPPKRWHDKENIYIEGSKFYWVNKDGKLAHNAPSLGLTLDVAQEPARWSLNLPLVNKKVKTAETPFGIWKIEDDALTVAVNLGKGTYPSLFTTLASAGTGKATHLNVYQRTPMLSRQKPSPKYGLNSDRAQATAAELKTLEKLWIVENREQNAASPSLVRFGQAVYFADGLVNWATKEGDLATIGRRAR